jgi:hypothetical protein
VVWGKTELAKFFGASLSMVVAFGWSVVLVSNVVGSDKWRCQRPLMAERESVGYPNCNKPVIFGHFVSHRLSGLDSPILF